MQRSSFQIVPFDREETPRASDDVLLTSDEAAALLRCSVRKLQYLVASGELRAVRIGRILRFRRSALLAFIERHES